MRPLEKALTCVPLTGKIKMGVMLRSNTDHPYSNSPPSRGLEQDLSARATPTNMSLPRFDAELRLRLAEKAQVHDFAWGDFTRHFVAPPGLFDDEL